MRRISACDALAFLVWSSQMKSKRLTTLVNKLRKMDESERIAFLLIEVLRAQGDACLNRSKLELLMTKAGVKRDMAYENIHVAMQNRADEILKRKDLLDADI